MANPPADSSNGSCYAAPGHRLDDRFLPCGNAALGTQTCCWQGDTCLIDGACFGVHGGSYITYLAGCTDEWYGGGDEQISSPSTCPPKGEAAIAAADAWVGLAYCNGSSDQWQACRQPGHPTTLTAAGPCACPSAVADRTVGVNAGPALAATASLPLSAGGSISWVSPYGPSGGQATSSKPASTVSTVSTASIETAGVTSSTALTNLTSSTSSGLSSSSAALTTSTTPSSNPPRAHFLIIGTCVGIGGSLLALAVVIAVLAFRHRRRRRPTGRPPAPTAGTAGITVAAGAVSPSYNNNDDKAPCPVDNTHTSAPYSTTVSELEPRPARPWSLRSELEDSSCRSPLRSSAGTIAAMLTGNTVGAASTAATVGTATITARESSTGATETTGMTGMTGMTPASSTWQGPAELE